MSKPSAKKERRRRAKRKRKLEKRAREPANQEAAAPVVSRPPPSVLERGEAYMRSLYPASVTYHTTIQLLDSSDTIFKTAWLVFAHDPDRGVKQSLMVVPQLGSHNELATLANALTDGLATKPPVEIGYGHADKASQIWTHEMASSPKKLLYTDALHVPEPVVVASFRSSNHIVSVIHESEMHSSLFISYGGPDEDFAVAINAYLKSHGVKTWFFPNDALPGQKLHRMMSTGIVNYDRVLLICSESSLKRAGVLNELERCLEREAKEGGSDVLIPVTIDDYVYTKWKPEREDIASQIRSRVITNIPNSDKTSVEFQAAMKKLLAALKKHSTP